MMMMTMILIPMKVFNLYHMEDPIIYLDHDKKVAVRPPRILPQHHRQREHPQRRRRWRRANHPWE